MVPYNHKVCAMFGCNFTPGVDKHYHRFPRDVSLRNIWVRECRRSDFVNPDTATICGLHFSASQLKPGLKFNLLNVSPPKNYRHLLPNAIPDINLPVSNPSSSKPSRPSANRVASVDPCNASSETSCGKCVKWLSGGFVSIVLLFKFFFLCICKVF